MHQAYFGPVPLRTRDEVGLEPCRHKPRPGAHLIGLGDITRPPASTGDVAIGTLVGNFS